MRGLCAFPWRLIARRLDLVVSFRCPLGWNDFMRRRRFWRLFRPSMQFVRFADPFEVVPLCPKLSPRMLPHSVRHQRLALPFPYFPAGGQFFIVIDPTIRIIRGGFELVVGHDSRE